MSGTTLTLEQAHRLAVEALVNHRTDPGNAALVAAEADGQKGHGLSRLPSYCGQAGSGKGDGFARPQVLETAAAAVREDHLTQRLETLVEAILDQESTRLSSDRRFILREQRRQNGIKLTEQQYGQLARLCAGK